MGRYYRVLHPFRRLEQLCGHARLDRALLVLVSGLCLPATLVGYQADDWLQQARLRGLVPGEPPAAFGADLFRFADPAANVAARDLGMLPWWAPSDLLVRLWRPLPAATHALDHAVAPGNAALAHVHSIAWLCALVAMVTALYRRLLGGHAAAGLAALVFAVDDAHGIPVGWLANRNALVTAALGVASLLLYDRYRRDGWRPGAVLGPLALGLGLLAGEAAVATVGWLVAYAIFVDEGAWRRRLERLVPSGCVVVGWRLAYTALGHGASGSGLYLDPLGDPRAFLLELPSRGAVLLADQLLGVPSSVFVFLSPAKQAWVLGATGTAIAYVAWRGFGALRGQRVAGFFALGMVLSLLPAAATFPSARLLTFAGIGGAGLLALVVAELGWRPTAPVPRWVVALVLLHLVAAPVLLPLQAYSPRAAADLLFNPCDDALVEQAGGKTAIFVNANELCANYVIPERLASGRAAPAAVRLLASGLYEVIVTGVDAHTIELGIPAGMQSAAADTLFRSPRSPLPPGYEVALSGVSFVVLSVNAEGKADRVRVRFDVPLDDPSLVWLARRGWVLSAFSPPTPGERVALPGAFD